MTFLIFYCISFSAIGQGAFMFEVEYLGKVEKYGTDHQLGIIHFVINGYQFQIDNDEGRVIDDFLLVDNNKIGGCRFYDEKENEITLIAEYDDNFNIKIFEVVYNKYSDKAISDVIRFINFDEYKNIVEKKISVPDVASEELDESAEIDPMLNPNIVGVWTATVADAAHPRKIVIGEHVENSKLFDIFFAIPEQKELVNKGTLKSLGNCFVSNTNNDIFEFVVAPFEGDLIFNNFRYVLNEPIDSTGYEGMYFSASQIYYIKILKTASDKYNIALAKRNEIGEYIKVFSIFEYNILNDQVVHFGENDERYVLIFNQDKIQFGNYTLKKQ